MGKNDLVSVKRLILVASGKGGVGKSTVAANLAVGIAKLGLQVGLMDADLYGPSIPKMFAATDRPLVRRHKIQPAVRFGVRLLSVGMLADAQKAFLWRGPILKGALKQLFHDTDWGELDVLLVDLPPGTGEIQIEIINLIDIFGSVFVATPQDVALASVRRSISFYHKLGLKILAIAENMSVFKCPECSKRSQIFPGNNILSLANEFDIKMVVHLPILTAVAASGDEGVPFFAKRNINDSEFALGIRELLTPIVSGLM